MVLLNAKSVFMTLLCTIVMPVFADEDNAALIQHGAYIARAADCAACHRSSVANTPPMAGGYAINSPMGAILASNITPSKQYGIGNYTEQQLADALRKGVSAKGKYLYPAMPYTAYRGMTDEDIHALYAYLQQGIQPVHQAVPKTQLSFPFNLRSLMIGWNLLYLDKPGFTPNPDVSVSINRGQYLVDNLAHCGTCHTPRNLLMAEDKQQYLAGAQLAGWIAPNITSDKVSGLGNWSEDDLVRFLKTGHLTNKAQAAGGMAEAVQNSLRYLSDSDLRAMANYLHSVPPIRDAQPVERVLREVQPVTMSRLETGQGDQASLADSSSLDGARLYSAACASCHGREGQGTSDAYYPSLSQNSSLNGKQANNLVMTILHGVSREGADLAVNMPAMGADLNDRQIAAVVNYSLQTFGNPKLSITADEVANLRQGGATPMLLKAMPYLLTLVGVLIVLLIIGAWRWTRRPKNS